jgi:hypothetical protein
LNDVGSLARLKAADLPETDDHLLSFALAAEPIARGED